MLMAKAATFKLESSASLAPFTEPEKTRAILFHALAAFALALVANGFLGSKATSSVRISRMAP